MAPALAALRAGIAVLEPRARRLLAETVAMPSGSYEAADVDRLGARFAAAWGALGFTEERRPVAGRGDLRLFRRPCAGGRGGRILLLGHLDTVWSRADSAGWDYAEKDGFASGPGVGDMKGGIATAWLAVSALLELEDEASPSEIALLLVPDEEIGSPGSRAFIEEEARRSRCVLVLEPARPDGGVVIGRGAVGAMVLRAEGRSAHVAVNPEEGISALLPLAALVAPLSVLGGEQGGCASIGILRGGSARQVVPDRAEMHVDLRAPSQAAAEALEAGIRALAAAQGGGAAVTVAGGVTRPAFPTAMGETLFRLYREIAEQAGIAVSALTTRGGSDGSFGAALGIPTLDGLGPICFDTCSRRERILLASLSERALLLAGLILRLTRAPDLPLSAA